MGIKITDTTLRDGNQSLIGGRMLTEDMLPIAEKLDKAGFYSLEVWGGVTFDTCIRVMDEDPWERLRQIKEKVKKTKLQMPLQGQLLVGQQPYPDDVVAEFIRFAVKNGIDIFSIYDALNDIRNMELSIKVAKDYGVGVQGSICYSNSPVATEESCVEMAGKLEALGCDSLCIKDTTGMITPQAAAELVKAIKAKSKLPLALHSHCSSGLAPFSYAAAIDAGVDIVDTAFAVLGGDNSQPAIESMVSLLKGTPNDPGLDATLIDEIGEALAALVGKYRMLINREVSRPSASMMESHISHATLATLLAQFGKAGETEVMKQVQAEIPKVWKEFGYPPLGTATSMLIATQSVQNVITGKRYNDVIDPVRAYFLGHYGQPPAVMDKKIKKQVIGNEKPVEARPADLLKPVLRELRKQAAEQELLEKEENLVTLALYPDIAPKFLKGEATAEPLPSSGGMLTEPKEFTVDVEGEVFPVVISPTSENMAFSMDVEGDTYDIKIAPVVGGKGKKREIPEGALLSKLQGVVAAINVAVGDEVSEGDEVVVVEAMKMHNKIPADRGGKVTEVAVAPGEAVKPGDILIVVE